MTDDLDALLTRFGGAAPRRLLLRHGVTRHRIDNAVKAGLLVAVYPATYCRPWDLDIGTSASAAVRERAAVMCAGRHATLSHHSALRRWQLLEYACPVHILVPAARSPRGGPELVVHRVRRYPPVVRLDGDLTVAAAPALAQTWPLLPVAERRGPVIDAVRRGVVTADQLTTTLEQTPRLPGRRTLVDLVALLRDGCESELEIWGHLEVFGVPGLDHGLRQRRVRAGGRTYRLDLAYEREQVAVELDGHRWHSSREQREHDMRRDAALAGAGWLTLRFSHRRLHEDVAGCRRDVLTVLSGRRER